MSTIAMEATMNVRDGMSDVVLTVGPDHTLRAAAAMVRGQFRHLVVIDGGELVGIISMRDIVRCWTATARATSVVDGGLAELAML
jgi:CBS domain-containing protein